MKTVKIAFCDNDAGILNMIAETTKIAFQMRGFKVDAYKFLNSTAFLEAMETGSESFDILMLEINMIGMDGITVCKQLLKSGAPPIFIFVSNDESKVFDTFSVHPFSFVRKNRFLKDMTETVNMYIDEMGHNIDRSVIIQTRETKKSIKLNDIMYIEGSKNYQKLVLKNGMSLLELRSTMESLTEKLKGYDFFRLHKGFLVNLRYVANLDKDGVILENGTQLPVSHRKYADMSEKYFAYLKEKGSVVL